MYMKILPHFMVVLGMLDRSRYLSAFETYTRDLLRVKELRPNLFSFFIKNLNRTTSCVFIEYQHRLLATLSEQISDRGPKIVDELICEFEVLREAEEFVEAYGVLGSAPHKYSMAAAANEELQVQLWSERCARICFDMMPLNRTSQASSVSGDTVSTTRFGGVSYPLKMTREAGVAWSAPWSRAKFSAVAEEGGGDLEVGGGCADEDGGEAQQ